MTTIELHYPEARRIARAALAAAATADDVPVIRGAHLELVDGQLAVTATNRYRAHRIYTRAETTVADGLDAFTLDRWALRFIVGASKLVDRRARSLVLQVTAEQVADTAVAVTLSILAPALGGQKLLTWEGDALRGFPVKALADLFEHARTCKPEPASDVRADWMSELAELCDLAGPFAVVKFAAPIAEVDDGKPGPVLLTWAGDDGTARAEALLQRPMMLRRARG